MKKKKIKNPLIRRIPRELTGDWKKYLVVSSVPDPDDRLCVRHVCCKREHDDSG